MLEAMSGVPAYFRNGRLDILAGNALARALFAPIFTSPSRPGNAARFTFLDPAAAEFYPDWDAVADQNVATLRRGRPQPLRQGPVGPDRRAVHPRRHLPAVLGPARSPTAPAGQLERYRQRGKHSTQPDLSSRSGCLAQLPARIGIAPGHEPSQAGQQRLAANCAPPPTS